MKKNYRYCILLVYLFLLIFSFPCGVSCQEFNEAGFFGRGVSKIDNGNVSEARRKAFIDAQEKVLISAVGSQMPVSDISEYFLMLKKLFFEHPDIYLQRFKIVSEHALYDMYQVNIHGFVQQEILRQDLESMGILGSGRKKKKVLLMITEKGPADSAEVMWWNPGRDVSAVVSVVNENLSTYFRDSGFYVIDPAGLNQGDLNEVKPGPDADPDEVARFASVFGADIAVIGRSELKKTESRGLTSVESIQCGMKARIIGVRDASVLVQAATYKLGMHVDELSAARAAVEKASMHLTGQIVDKIYLKLRSINGYMFRLSMAEGSGEDDVERWLDALKSILPDVVPASIENEDGIWVVKIDSPMKRADIVQKILQFGVEGYVSELVSADEGIIEMKILSKQEILQ